MMDNENEVLCEKIINDINAVFLKDSDLSSFEIIPTVLNQNKSPVIHIGHNLGLESWCAKHVYDYAHKTIIAHKLSGVSSNRNKYNSSDSIVKYINIALLINPDVTSFWHIRRQLVQKNRLKVYREFLFSALVLTKKPKSSDAFAYRRWLFSFESSESIDWSVEIGICDRCADKCSSNYHAWSHRLWVLQKAQFLLKSEILLTEKFMRKHISDYSSYHYRQIVIARLFDNNFYNDDDKVMDLSDIKYLINYYLIAVARTEDEILSTLLPNIDYHQTLSEEKIKSFLYCCNLAAHDIKMCDDQKNMFGHRESFENHRRESLKFIVDQCIKLNAACSNNDYCCRQQPLSSKIPKYDYSTNAFLSALKRSEGMLGEKHRKWCSLFLGFDYSSN